MFVLLRVLSKKKKLYLNVATNTYDEIGSVSYIFESMEFSSNGTCYAMTASNDDTPSRLVTVNLLNGSVSILADLSNDDGEGFAQALVYDESSETMYRCTGGGGDFGSQFYYWQTINLTTNTITNQEVMFPGLSDSFPWVMAMCYQGPNEYLLADQAVMYNIDSNGDFDTPRSLNFGDQRYSGIVLATDQQIEGCMDPTACNYNSEATLDSFDCAFLPMDDDCAYCSGETDGTGEVIVGMDSDNDWICDLDEIEIWGTDPFVQDTDGDGITDGAEILVVMTDPLNIDTNNNDCDDLNELIDGCGIGPDDCLGDFNSDGLVNATDLLVFLGSFGSVCN